MPNLIDRKSIRAVSVLNKYIRIEAKKKIINFIIIDLNGLIPFKYTDSF